MLLTQKNHCDEHDRACYITGLHHLFLTPQHLSTWAASIVSFLFIVAFKFIFIFYLFHNLQI